MQKQQTIVTRLVIERIKEIAPEEYDNCVNLAIPIINDTSLISEVIKQLRKKYSVVGDDMVFMIAVVYELFYPYKNYYQNIKLEQGIREIMREAFGFQNGEMINHHAKYIIPAYKGARYRQRVNDEVQQIIKQLNNN